ncbi:AAA family ATPase [Streptobacillus felis]|uniref:AAA family ATPase n=1 Tax=Streptobacillus felis TaxID=1384509 RepID=UPI000830A0EF|nr:AAA family ATPase [Streptobacillus felis]
MKIASIKINNFRGYSNEVKFEFDNLTAIIGRNDVGKSTVLEALDIFFNDGKGVVKLDRHDINRYEFEKGNNEISISICFDNLPESVILDSSFETNLKKEYLLNSEEQLEVIKRYPNGSSAKVYIKAIHPQNPKCTDLLLKKNSELKK